MIKKSVITLALVLVTAIAGLGMAPKSDMKPSDYDKGLTYEQAAKLNKPILAFFYVDWCGYCQRFVHKMKALHQIFDSKYSIVMINCEDKKNEKLVHDYRVGGFPTLYIIDPKIDNKIHIDNAYISDILSLKGELDRYIRVRSLMKLP